MIEPAPVLRPTAPGWPRPPRLPRRSLPPAVDVLVVGAGLTGVSLARFLAAHDVSFAVLESDAVASGASGRTAGFVLQGTAQNYAAAVDRFGRARAREIWQFTRDNHRLLRELIGTADNVYRRRGSWLVAVSAAEAAELRESESLLRSDGFAVAWHDKTDVPQSHGALHLPEDGEVIPTLAIWEMAAPVRQQIYEETTVEAIEVSGNGVRVATARGEIDCSAAIVATNGLIPRLLPGVPIIPFRGQMLATAPVAPLPPHFPAYADHGFRYWRQLEDGSLHIGGLRNLAEPEEIGDDIILHQTIQTELTSLARLLIGDHEVIARWAGIMGGTPDDLPLVGALPGRLGIYVCGGYTGHGFGFATLAARQLVASLMGGGEVAPYLRAQRVLNSNHG